MLDVSDLVTTIDAKIEALKIAEIQADPLVREDYLRTATAA